MKNEIKTIIVLSLIIVLLVGVIIYRELDQRSKNRAYQDNITKLETAADELRDTTKQLRTDIQTVEKERTKALEIVRENGEVIRRLEHENNSLRENNKGFDEDLEELEKLLSWFFDN